MRMLVIEDNPDHLDLIRDTFYQVFDGKGEIDCCNEFLSGIEKLSDGTYDICLCDLQLPDSTLEMTLAQLKRLKADTPIVVLTSINDLDMGRHLISQGVQDYLPKDELTPSLLSRVVTYAIERNKQQLLLESINRDQQVFCATLTHDFKSPLRRIAMLSDFLRESLSERIGLNEQELEWFDFIDTSCKTVQNLIQNLYSYLSVGSRLQEKTAIDLSQLIARVEDWLCSNEKRKFILQVDAMPRVKGWEAELFIVFQNIMSNAIKYNTNEPMIKISHGISKNGGGAVVSVSDNGVGINPEYLETIFAPFIKFDTEIVHAGSGLGLSIVKRIMENHGGNIEVQSELGKGATFYLQFPEVA